MSEPETDQNQHVVGRGQVRVMTFEPTVASLDDLIAGLRTSISYGVGFADHNAAPLLLLAELLKQALEKKHAHDRAASQAQTPPGGHPL